MRPRLHPYELLGLGLFTAVFLLASLPYLADYPPQDWPQMGIAAPAWKLAHEGVYGNDLFEGFHRSELRNYEYMPAYPLLVAAGFRSLGLGVKEARLVSLLCGWATMILTFTLGRLFWGRGVGFAAAGVLLFLRLGLLPGSSGIPLLDLSRLIRYDILVPVPVLGSTICFLLALDSDRRRRRAVLLLAAGALAGIAGLAHVYGAFILGVLLAVLAWRLRTRVFTRPDAYLVSLGFLLAVMPWITYVAADLESYIGQMSRHVGRFDLLDPAFYWQNLLREPGRFHRWLEGGFPATLLRPRVGIWLLLGLLPVAFVILTRRVLRPDSRASDVLLWISLPFLELCLALLIYMKRPNYVALLLPFLGLWLGIAGTTVWRLTAKKKLARVSIGLVLCLALVETGSALAAMRRAARTTSPYLEVCARIAHQLPTARRILISQPYWLCLEQAGDYELRSIHLAFLLAKTMSVDTALAGIAPDAVIIERRFLEPEPNDPRGPQPGSPGKEFFLEVAGYLERRCSADVGLVDDATYGMIEIYSCTDGNETGVETDGV